MNFPLYITIGSSIRYDEATVEAWLQERLQAGAQVFRLKITLQ